MTKQIINTGTGANSRDGDSLRNAFTKVNANFTELYDLISNISPNVTDTGNITFDSETIIGNATMDFTNGLLRLVPNSDENFSSTGQFLNIYPTNQFDAPHIHIAAGSGSTSNGDLILGDDTHHVDINHNGHISIKSVDPESGNTKNWQFDSNGNLILPQDGDILDSNGNSVLDNALINSNTWVQTFESDNPTSDFVVAAVSVKYDNNGNLIGLFNHVTESGNTNGSYFSVAKMSTTGSIIWRSRFSDLLYTDGWGLAVGSNSIYVAGQTSNGYPSYATSVLIKLDLDNGAIQWEKEYDFGFDSYSPVVDIAIDNNLVVVGFASEESDNYITVTKIDYTTGNIVWTRKLDGQSYEDAYGMGVGPNGETVVVGYMDYLGINAAVLTLYTDPVSNVNWITDNNVVAGSISFDVSFTDGIPTFTNIIDSQGGRQIDSTVTTVSGALIGGVDGVDDMVVKVGSISSVPQEDRMIVAKYNADGVIEWQNAVQFDEGFSCYGADADIDSFGNIYVTGQYDKNNEPGGALSIVKFNSSGTALWSRRVIGNCETFGTSIVVGPDNSLYLSGITNIGDINNPPTDSHSVLARYNQDGTVVWQRLLENATTWSFAGAFFQAGASNLTVKNGYVAISGGYGVPFNDLTQIHANIAQFPTTGNPVAIGDWNFTASGFSGTFFNDASDITVVNANKVDSNNIETIIVTNSEMIVDTSNFLLGTIYRAGNNYTDELTTITGEQVGETLTITQNANAETPGLDNANSIDYIPTSILTANDWIINVDNYSTLSFANGDTRQITGWNTDAFGDSGFISLDTAITLNSEQVWPIVITSYNYSAAVTPGKGIDVEGNVWKFDNTGDLTLPEGGDILDSNGNSLLSGLPSITMPAITGTTYKGLQVSYGMIHSNSNNDELNINKIVIYEPLATTTTIDLTSASDEFQVSGIGTSNILAMFVIYGNLNGPKAITDLQAFAELAIDTVILDGGIEGQYNTVDNMKTAFYNNYSALSESVNGIDADFEFFNVNTNFDVITSTFVEGSGAVFTVFGANSDYVITVNTPGNNYKVGHKLRIVGTDIGQSDTRWDLIFTVSQINSDGGIMAVTYELVNPGFYADGTWTGITGINYQVGNGFVVYTLSYNLVDDTLSLGSYDSGSNYVAGDVVTILGTNIRDANNSALASPTNDITILFTSVDAGYQFSITGTLPRPANTWPSNYISDGGNDQYDSGNYISTNLAQDISYNNGETVTNGEPAFGAGSEYTFVYDTGIFGLFATGNSATLIRTSGNSGADGNSIAVAGNIYGPNTSSQTFDNAITHINIVGNTYVGEPVSFVHVDDGDEVDILITDDGNGAGVGITRDASNGIYNPYRDEGWNDAVSPSGTLWNIDGWENFSNIETRTYLPLYAAFGSGGLGNKIVSAECVMYLPDNGKYYAIKFTQWTQGNMGGGFAYTRQEINLNYLNDGIRFRDGTLIKSAEGIGRVKLISPGNRRIEEAYGFNAVSVTSRITTNYVGASARTTNSNYEIFVKRTQELDTVLQNLQASQLTYSIEISFDNITFTSSYLASTQQTEYWFYYNTINGYVPQTEDSTVYIRIVTGGDPAVWWDKSELPGGSEYFRGAIIKYHAYTGDATWIGTIHIADDNGDNQISHSEVVSGSTTAENDDLWLVENEGTISYRRIDGENKTLKVQWSATVFYGSELYD